MFQSLKKLFAKQPTAPTLHPQLAELVDQMQVRGLLEIGMGDGQRTSLLIQRLQATSVERQLRYFAVDTFEAASTSGLSLKQAFLLLRSFHVPARFLPGDAAAVLKEESNNIQGLDLILLSATVGDWQQFGIYLPRMLSPNGRVFREVIEPETQTTQWVEIPLTDLEQTWYRSRRKHVA